jgi:hypothetical protein
VFVALVTGNLEPIGWGKMDALGIGDLFSQPRFGGFGSDHCSGDTQEVWHDRAELIRVAQRKCPGVPPYRWLHLEDTLRGFWELIRYHSWFLGTL